jgi:Glycosyltransferase 61
MVTDKGFSLGSVSRGEPLTRIDAALIVPETRARGYAVVDAQGAPIVDALTIRAGGMREIGFVDRDQVKPAQHLKGGYLFAGEYWWHFGHFLFESMSRLWALDLLDEPLDGLVFLNPRGERPANRAVQQQQLLDLLGIRLPLIRVTSTTEVEHLIVPRQGFGLGALAAGTPFARGYFQSRFRAVVPRRGAEKIYISRAGYKNRRGGILVEHVLERLLAAEGYTPFQPEQHSIEEQIATYLGARQIIGPDSSALHLYGFVGTPAQDLAIVLRRTIGAVDMLPQITGFTGRKPLVIDAIQRIWTRDNARRASWADFAQLDFPALGQALHRDGYIADPAPWAPLTRRQLAKTQESLMAQLGCTFTFSEPQRG